MVEAAAGRFPARRLLLTFHGIGTPERQLEPGEAPVWVDRAAFEAVLDRVRDQPAIVVTFDDGNASDFEIALPALRARGMTGEFFVATALLDRPGYLTRAQLRELAASGMVVGSHGRAHTPWRGLAPERRAAEIRGVRDELEALLEQPVTRAACPFGAYDRTALRSLREAGFERVYTSDGGFTRPGAWLQARNTILDGQGPQTVEALLAEAPNGPRALLRRAKTAVKRLR